MIFKIFRKKDIVKEDCNVKVVEKKSWFQRLKERLKLSSSLFSKILNVFSSSGDIDFDLLEELLLETDMDFELVSQIIDKIKIESKSKKLSQEDAKFLMRNFMLDILKQNHNIF